MRLSAPKLDHAIFFLRTLTLLLGTDIAITVYSTPTTHHRKTSTHHTFPPSLAPIHAGNYSIGLPLLVHYPPQPRPYHHHSPLNRHQSPTSNSPPARIASPRSAALAKNPLSPYPTTTDADADTEQHKQNPHETIPDAAPTTTNNPTTPSASPMRCPHARLTSPPHPRPLLPTRTRSSTRPAPARG